MLTRILEALNDFRLSLAVGRDCLNDTDDADAPHYEEPVIRYDAPARGPSKPVRFMDGHLRPGRTLDQVKSHM